MDTIPGKLLGGNLETARKAYATFRGIPLDWDLAAAAPAPTPRRLRRTIGRGISVRGPGTFFGKSIRTITFEPSTQPGWWFERTDLGDTLPFAVSARNVWTTGDMVSNIVLRAGPPHNYVRMVEHIIAFKPGLGLDDLRIRIDSGDPPLFVRGSLDLADALTEAGIVECAAPVRYVTVTEPVCICDNRGALVALAPADPARPELRLDCAVDFPTAIGRQRLRYTMNPIHFRLGAEARTNTSYSKMLYCRTIGRLFADVRNLGYTSANILIAGKHDYKNEPRLLHEGKSLEAIWHRAALDLPAALALVEEGQFVGDVLSYRAGHTLDVRLICRLYRQGLLKMW